MPTASSAKNTDKNSSAQRRMSPSSALHEPGSRRILEKSSRIGAPYTRFVLSTMPLKHLLLPSFQPHQPDRARDRRQRSQRLQCPPFFHTRTVGLPDPRAARMPYQRRQRTGFALQKTRDAVAKPRFLDVEHQGMLPGSPAVKYRHFFFTGMHFPRENPPYIRLAFRSPSFRRTARHRFHAVSRLAPHDA